jgi:hypothetical protein
MVITRRELSALLLAPPLQPTDAAPAAIQELQLEPAEQQALAEEGKRALQQAGWLRELPLEGVAPGFVFLAR